MVSACFLRANDLFVRLCRLIRLGVCFLPVACSSPVAGQNAPIPEPPATTPSATTTIETPDRSEMRGMWVVRTSLISPQSVHQIVVTAVKYHLNTLFVQVRGRGDAWYNSPYEPRAEPLARQPKGFDPLSQLVTEAHANGLQVHAWLNTFLTWSGSRAPSSPQHLWNAHRDWFACDRNGHCSCLPNNASEGAFLQPSNPAVQEHLFKVFTYVAANYDLDGIHFDYCRYGNSGFDFSASTLARFRAFLAGRISEETAQALAKRLPQDRKAYVHAFPKDWADWRRDQITSLVARISAAVKADKPWMQVSAAVFADADDAYASRGQDWLGWLKAGALDAVALMAYDKNTARVLAQTRRAVTEAGGSRIYVGLGAWRLSARDVARKIAEIRQAGAAGICLFSYDGVHTRNNYLETLKQGVFAGRVMRGLPSRSGPVKRVPADTPDKGQKPEGDETSKN